MKYSEILNQAKKELKHKETFSNGITSLLSLRNALLEEVNNIFTNTSIDEFSMQPLIKSKGYDSKTIGYSIYHIARIEDIVVNTLILNEVEVFTSNCYKNRLHSTINTTGNELVGLEIKEFTSKLDIYELHNYYIDVTNKTNKFISNLTYSKLKEKISEESKNRLIEANVVSKDQLAYWLIDYWASKDILGLIGMPLTRHHIMHIEASNRIKQAIDKKKK